MRQPDKGEKGRVIKMKIGFIGLGNMANAMIGGILVALLAVIAAVVISRKKKAKK